MVLKKETSKQTNSSEKGQGNWSRTSMEMREDFRQTMEVLIASLTFSFRLCMESISVSEQGT